MNSTNAIAAIMPDIASEKQKLHDSVAEELKQLEALRENRQARVEKLHLDIEAIKKNRDLDDETRAKLIAEDKRQLAIAKGRNLELEEQIKAAEAEGRPTEELKAQLEAYNAKEKEERDLIKEIGHQGVLKLKECYKEVRGATDPAFASARAKAKDEYGVAVQFANDEYAKELAAIEAAGGDPEEVKTKKKNALTTKKNRLFEAKNFYTASLQKIKDSRYELYQESLSYERSLLFHKTTLLSTIENKWETYRYKFNLNTFLLNNAIYLILIVFFIFACIISRPAFKTDLLTWGFFSNLFNQSSPRIILALGVAGLIVLAGTDLSVGRLVGLSAFITFLMMQDSGSQSLKFFDIPIDTNAMSLGGRIFLCFFLSIIFCMVFSGISGFFSARFKMHPFVSTLATQLIVYGIIAFASGNQPSGKFTEGATTAIAGYMGSSGLSKIVIWMIIIVAIMWFVWNKTKFGKYMFAVGGNGDAASVSGISVFWITMAVFLIAGALYGIGGTLETFRIGSGNADFGFGYESDAIAACVVGGISFSGGVGKIRGAVIGAILFTAINLILSYWHVNVNLQSLIKGIIILVAVTLDCAKYLKKK